MTLSWLTGFGIVTAIAALKTFIVYNLVLTSSNPGWAILSGLFALFFALTAIVAYLSYVQLRGYISRQRKEKLTPGASEPIAKETVVLRYAPDWGLSQSEADVAIFVAKGFSNAEIAEMRGSAVTTVKSQLGRIYQKSGLETRYQLIAFVTDEVCSMAKVSDKAEAKLDTQKALPLASRRTENAA
ncbi:MAG: helix-turn-helix transcriptional regulator [Roseovarius sp.]|uniref:helix-turn-helix transcriptional regulator n=1 Tax=Roseovarius sp. TaxID=1486281 RepID=UPI0032ED80DF